MLSNRPKQRRTEMPFEMPSAEDLVKERAQLSQESDKCRLLIENEELQKLRRLCNDSNTTETTLKKAQAPSFIVAPQPLLQRLLENPCLQGSNNKLLEVYLELITTKTDDVIIETTEEMLFDIEECVLTEYETWSMDDKNTVELLCWLFVVALWKNNGLPKVISLFLSILTMQQQNVIEAVSDALIFAANGDMTVLLAALDLTKGPQPQHKLFTKHLCNVTLNSIAPKPETEPTSICKRVLQAWGELNIEQQFWAIEAVARGIAATRYEDNWSISEETDLQKLVNVAMAPTSPNLKYSVLHVAMVVTAYKIQIFFDVYLTS
ncbi:unnamed protein product [Leptosia nina]|uniref:Uncharacterized protein n=1 Tax=Leptosia nina TaxID=320188 RepID=A0AAV1J3V9_9NEOP